MITRKKPTDDMFVGELTLKQWINAYLPDRMIEVVDEGLLRKKKWKRCNCHAKRSFIHHEIRLKVF